MPTEARAEPAYVLVTAARNEEAFIDGPIRSVLAQTVLPRKWVIVSNGSRDRTDEIVRGFAERHPFIELLSTNRGDEAGFGAKARAVQMGCERLRDVDYEFIGNLDADVTFPPEYFETILAEFGKDPRLGIAGGLILELMAGRYVPQRSRDYSVAGAVQLFRRRCHEQVGGYLPIRQGGEDAAAEIMARMHGWTVRTVRKCAVLHPRPVRGGTTGILSHRFNRGIVNYLLGYHPLFELGVCTYRLLERPFLVGGVLTLAGYLWAGLRRLPRPVGPDFVRFLRAEQLARLRLGPRR